MFVELCSGGVVGAYLVPYAAFLCEPGDPVAEVVSEAEEAPGVSGRGWDGHLLESGGFSGVRLAASAGHDVPKIGCLLEAEVALVEVGS